MKYAKWILLALLLPVMNLKSQPYIINLNTLAANAASSSFNQIKPGDTVWLQAGNRDFLRISNFHGSADHPIVFANLNGPVIVQSTNSYGIAFSNCSFFKLAGLPGPGYAYGIIVKNVPVTSGVGISADQRSTNLEFEKCEVANTGFAGIMAKTDPVCGDPTTYRNGFTQYNTVIHDCYVHDVGGEGMYIGHSSYNGLSLDGCTELVLPSVLDGVAIYHNKIERSGWDGIQVSSAVRNCCIHHNLLINCSTSMTPKQMSGIMIGGGTLAECYNNAIIDCYSTGIVVLGKGGTIVYNNLIVRPAKKYEPDDMEKHEGGIFLGYRSSEDKTFFGIYNNTIIQPKSDGIRIDALVDFPVQIYNNAIIDPGAYDFYKNGSNGLTGAEAFVFNASTPSIMDSAHNFFSRSASSPGFMDFDGDDFHLTAPSPLIDAGLNLTTLDVQTDFDDKPRPFGNSFDIGAYEFDPSGTFPTIRSTPDFSVDAVHLDADQWLSIDINSKRDMLMSISLVNLLGQPLCSKTRQRVTTGCQTFTFHVTTRGIAVLTIQSDSAVYARKIILL